MASTSLGQRIAIWVIAAVLTVGTLVSFVAVIIANENQQTQQARANELYAAYEKELDAYQKKLDAQAATLSEKYFGQFSQYAARVSAFDAESVSELKVEDLKVGEGERITKESSFTAYYIGWNPTGKIFDQSIEGDHLKPPFSVVPGGVIQGWTEGVDGMKIGGIRELTIPANKAYGDQAVSDDIPANTPLKFIIMIIPTPEVIEQPQPSEELLQLYSS